MNIIVRELYNYSVYAWYILYALSFLGLYAKAPEYLTTVDLILRVFVQPVLSPFNPNPLGLGSDVFNNSTRQQLKET